jgi:GH24 family phage-related lysozyme (muramidase)
MSDLFQYDTTGDMTTMGGQLSPTINVQPNMQAAKAFQGLSNMLQSYGNMKVVEGQIETAEAKRQQAIRDEEIKKAATADYLDISTSVAQAESQLKIDLQNAKTPDDMDLAYSFFNESLNFELQDRRPEALEKAAKETNNTFLKGQEVYNKTMLKFGEGEQKVLETKQYTQAVQTVSAFSSYFDEQLLLNANNKEEIVKLRAKNLAALDNQFKGLSVDNQKALSKHFATERERVIKQSAVALKKINQTTFGNELQSSSPAFANMPQQELSKHYKTVQQAGELVGLTKEEIGEKFFTTTFNTAINSIDEESMVNNRDYTTIQNLNDTVDRLLATDPRLKDKPFVLKAKQDIAKLKNGIDSAIKSDVKAATTDFAIPQEDFNTLLDEAVTQGAMSQSEALFAVNDRVNHMTTSPAAVTRRASSYVEAATSQGQAVNLRMLDGMPEQAAATKMVKQQINKSLIEGDFVLVGENLKTNPKATTPLVENYFNALNKEINNLAILKVKPEQEEEKNQKLMALVQRQQQLSFHSTRYLSEEQAIENQVALEIAKGTIAEPQKFLVALKDANVPLINMNNDYVQDLYDELPVNQEYKARVKFSTLVASGMDEKDAYNIVSEAYSLKEIGDTNIAGNGAFKQGLGDFDQDKLPIWLETLKAKLPIEYEEQIEEFMIGKNPQIVLNNNLLELYTEDGAYLPIPMTASMMAEITSNATVEAAKQEREGASALGVLTQDAATGVGLYINEVGQEIKDLNDYIQTSPIGDPLDKAADVGINFAVKMGRVASELPSLLDSFLGNVYINNMDRDKALEQLTQDFKKVFKNLPKPTRFFEETEAQKIETEAGAKRFREMMAKNRTAKTKQMEESKLRYEKAEGLNNTYKMLKEAVGSVLDFIIPEAEASDKPTGATINPMNTQSINNVPKEFKKVYDHLLKREGFRDKSYKDTLGKLTGGVGHLLTAEEKKLYPEGTKIPKEVTDRWLIEDTEKAINASLIQAEDLGILDKEFIDALVSVNFQLGTNWNKKFPTAYKHLKNAEYERAIKEIKYVSENSKKKSKWAEQTPVRVNDFVQAIKQLD